MNRSTQILIGILFIISGLTSLVYESLWIRTLSLSLGSTSTSMSLVLSIFFFGMSMGSYLAGSLVHKITKPLRAYGLIEGFIGLYAFGLIYVLNELTAIVSYIPGGHSSSLVAMIFKGGLVALLLGPPTIAMGATLPLLIKTLSDPKIGVGKNISRLYAVNTLGAVLGAFSAGFIFIPKSGVLGTNSLMVVLNLAILGICLLLSSKINFKSIPKKAVHHGPVIWAKMSPINKIVVLSAGLVGLASIGVEVIWSKYLGMFLGTNIFGLSLVLAIFLSGIALGSYFLSLFIDKIKNKVALYLNLLAITIVALIFSTWALNWTPVISHIISYYLPAFSLLVIKSAVVSFILLIPTGFFGALLPLAVNLVTIDEDSAPAVTGKVYAVNTWGSILGSAITGLWLIPAFGSGKALLILTAVLIFAFSLVLYHGFLYQERRILGPIKLASCVFLIFAMPTVKFDNIVKSAYFSYMDPGNNFEQVVRVFDKDYDPIVFLKEGKTAIISLNYEEDANGETNKRQLRMKTNGLNESYYDLDELDVIPKYEGLLGLVPFLHLENPQSAFIVGYGGGYTTDLLTSLDIPKVHVAEIEESVLEIADYIHKGDNPILKRKNLKLEIEDARFVLNSKKQGPYDIIVSQPSHSWISGVANLFTKDFFETAKGSLTENGVFAQWLNLYNMDQESLKSILKTYYQTFPHGVLYTDEDDYQLIMLGSQKPLKFNREKLRELTRSEEWRRRLALLPFENEYDFLSSFSMGRDKVVETTMDSPINTDDNAYAEIRQSSLFYTTDSEAQLAQPYFRDNFDTQFGNSIAVSKDEPLELVFGLLKSLGQQQKYSKYFDLVKQYEAEMLSDKKYAGRLAEVCFEIERQNCATENFLIHFRNQKSEESLNALLNSLNQAQRFSESVQYAKQYKKWINAQSQCLVTQAQVELGSTPKKYQKDPQQLLQECGEFAQVTVGQIYMTKLDYENAIETLKQSLKEDATDLKALGLLIESHLKINQLASVSYYSELFKEYQTSEYQRIKTLADYYSEMGWQEDSEILNRRIAQLEE